MITAGLLATVIALSSAATPAPQPPAPSPSQGGGARIDDLPTLHARASRSVVLLKVYDATGTEAGQGTGFVTEGGVIVTNHHVVEGGSRIEARTFEDKPLVILALRADDEKNDLAVLEPEPHALASLRVTDREVPIGERVVVVGNPLGLAGTLSEGIVSAFRKEGIRMEEPGPDSAAPRLQISAPISPGSSGSPVMDERGGVIGVAVSGIDGGQSLNFAVPSVAVLRDLAEAKRGPPVRLYQSDRRGRSMLLRNLAISAGVFTLLGILVIKLSRSGE